MITLKNTLLIVRLFSKHLVKSVPPSEVLSHYLPPEYIPPLLDGDSRPQVADNPGQFYI